MPHSSSASWRTLLVWLLGLAGVWLVVLPWLGNHSAVRERIEFLEEHQIDHAALFYSDLEGMEAIETKLQESQRKHPDAFWVPSFREASPDN